MKKADGQSLAKNNIEKEGRPQVKK